MANTRIIINNGSDLDDLEALRLVTAVVNQGQISETSLGKQYCFATGFTLETTGNKPRKFNVYVRKNKTGTQTFYVTNDTRKDEKKAE